MVSENKKAKIRQAISDGIINEKAGDLKMFDLEERLVIVRALQETKSRVWKELFEGIVSDAKEYPRWNMVVLAGTMIPFVEANKALLFTDEKVGDAAVSAYKGAGYDIELHQLRRGIDEPPFDMMARLGIAEFTINRGNSGVIIKTSDVVDVSKAENPDLGLATVNYSVMNNLRPGELRFWERRVIQEIKNTQLYILPAEDYDEDESNVMVMREEVELDNGMADCGFLFSDKKEAEMIYFMKRKSLLKVSIADILKMDTQLNHFVLNPGSTSIYLHRSLF